MNEKKSKQVVECVQLYYLCSETQLESIVESYDRFNLIKQLQYLLNTITLKEWWRWLIMTCGCGEEWVKEEMFTKERRRDKQREGGKGENSEGVKEKKRERSEGRSVFTGMIRTISPLLCVRRSFRRA